MAHEHLPTCGTLYRAFEEQCPTLFFLQSDALPHGDMRLADRAIGHMRGQAEKVFLHACPAFMIRPASDWWNWALMAMEFVCEHYHLSLYIAKDEGEIWGCRTPSIRIRLHEVLKGTPRESAAWHQRRGALCGIAVEALDTAYHLRAGSRARCEPLPEQQQEVW